MYFREFRYDKKPVDNATLNHSMTLDNPMKPHRNTTGAISALKSNLRSFRPLNQLGTNASQERELGRVPYTPQAHTTRPSNMHEDGGAVMSVGSSSISPISGDQSDKTASAVMSMQNRFKNLFKQKIARRKSPVF